MEINLKESYPSDWIEYKFGYLFEFVGGMALSRSNLSNEGICYLHYGDIHKLSGNYIDVEKEYDTIPKLNERLENINEKYFLRDGDIVFADASEDYEGIGKSVVVINKTNIPFISGLHTIIARDKSNLLDNSFKRFFLSDWNIRKQIMVIASGISVYGISKENIKNIRTVIPPINEQRKIASILSTWDKAIELKEKLIEQKKLQKKGLMQRLLTGELRLPGVKREWKTIKLGDVAEIYQPKTISQSELKKTGYPVYGANGLIGYYDKYNHETWQIMITCRGSTCGSVNKTDGKAWITGNAMVVNVDKSPNIDKDFIYYLCLIQNYKKIIGGSGQPQITKKPLEEFKIFIPLDIKEQKQIAKILLFADKEINFLEKELAEIKQQKKGLMQLLLTGKVRVKV